MLPWSAWRWREIQTQGRYVHETDVLIDEARTPLIISGQIEDDEKPYRLANVFIKMLLPDDISVDYKEKTVSLTE